MGKHARPRAVCFGGGHEGPATWHPAGPRCGTCGGAVTLKAVPNA